MTHTRIELKEILAEAREQAYQAAQQWENTHYARGEWGACGFAWVELLEHGGNKLKGNTRMGRLLKQVGVEQNWERLFHIWNPSGFPTQNVDTLEAGARAAAEVFRQHGFDAVAGSRLD